MRNVKFPSITPPPGSYTRSYQLSQKDRAMLDVIEYIHKSLNVIRNDTID